MAGKSCSVLPCFLLVAHCLVQLGLSADLSQLVTGLPGQPAVKFKQFAGQLPINENQSQALFYWFYEAEQSDTASFPLVLWLNGGPGCSSVGNGALGELGPFRTNSKANGLTINPYSWNKAANVIFLESPVGVGFSYSNFSADYNDNQTAMDNLSFLVEWFKKFPEYKNNDFYVTGESYAGHYIPTLATHIVAYNNKAKERLNFKGIAIGNPWTYSLYENIGNLKFQYTHSMISDELYQEAVHYCYSSKPAYNKCDEAQQKIGTITQYINLYNVYVPNCNTVNRTKSSSFREKLMAAYDPCLDSISPYLNLPEVQAALHVVTRPVAWSSCSDTINTMYSNDDFQASVIPLYRPMIKTGIRIWIFSGDVDSVVSTLSTRAWLKVLNLTVEKPWYAWDYKGQVGGWSEVYEGLTFTTVRGSGHMVPLDQPGPSLALFQSFLSGKALPAF